MNLCLVHTHMHTLTSTHLHTHLAWHSEKFPSSTKTNILNIFTIKFYEREIAGGRKTYAMWKAFDSVLNYATTTMYNLFWTTKLVKGNKEWERAIDHLPCEFFFKYIFLHSSQNTKMLRCFNVMRESKERERKSGSQGHWWNVFFVRDFQRRLEVKNCVT